MTASKFVPGDGIVAPVEAMIWPGYILGPSEHQFCALCHCDPAVEDHYDGTLCCTGPWYAVQMINPDEALDRLRPMTYAEHELIRSGVNYAALIK